MRLLAALEYWWDCPARWYEFWMPRSGLVGGMIAGAFICAVTLPIISCSAFQPVQQLAVPTNLSEAGREAAKIINEAKVDLIAANNTITSQVKAGLMTKQDATYLSAKVDEFWGKGINDEKVTVKKLEALLGSGQDLLAKQQAQLLSTLLVELQKQVVARSKK